MPLILKASYQNPYLSLTNNSLNYTIKSKRRQSPELCLFWTLDWKLASSRPGCQLGSLTSWAWYINTQRSFPLQPHSQAMASKEPKELFWICLLSVCAYRRVGVGWERREEIIILPKFARNQLSVLSDGPAHQSRQFCFVRRSFSYILKQPRFTAEGKAACGFLKAKQTAEFQGLETAKWQNTRTVPGQRVRLRAWRPLCDGCDCRKARSPPLL